MNLPCPSRRRLLGGTLGAAAQTLFSTDATALAPLVRPPDAPAVQMTQIMDMSPSQQALSRDYATGFRLAFAESTAKAGPRIELKSIEVDGSDAALQEAIKKVKADSSQVALIGTVGEGLALASLKQAEKNGLEIAHVAPWLADSRFDGQVNLFALFASREDQIRYVLKGFATMGVSELGIVYPNAAHEAALQPGTAQILERLKLRARVLTASQESDLESFGRHLDAKVPYFLLFMGSAIELSLFTRGLSKRGMQRYVVCLSDVDANTFLQLAPGTAVPIVFTRVVPDPRDGKVAVVRAYKSALQRYFDEDPSPTSLAGYLGGRYAASVVASAGSTPGRARVLSEFKRRVATNIDGWRFDFAADGRASSYVSQTLLNSNGRLVG
ncbi:ABC transporter substrate-binding protein [Variovorax sp. PAMC28562]|uniref:ABC transporter substrate-binding protein n=1 Tax=Variovorax sp. PAMC28562 TaxID=2762323 RepID=UPI00164D9B82|nr:ABC transporter substrate-binding protein [Variovorax sp. PAMC28562]QNK74466.1 ABC transporter substrate-binding protein [Variovorax sp. PAMC28562]